MRWRYLDIYLQLVLLFTFTRAPRQRKRQVAVAHFNWVLVGAASVAGAAICTLGRIHITCSTLPTRPPFSLRPLTTAG